MCEVLIDSGCNQNCRHCFLGQTKNRTLTPIETTKNVSEALRKQGYLLYPYSTEALFSEEAFENFISLTQPNKTHFLTNGTAPLAKVSSKELINRFISNQISHVRISLHGNNADTHEFLTRTPNSYEIARNTIKKVGKYVNQHDIKFTLFMVVHKENINEMADVFAFAFENNVQHIFLLKLIQTYHCEVPNRVIMDRQSTADALLEVGRLRRHYQDKMRIELSVPWGVNFHTSGIYKYLSGMPRRPDIDAAYKTLKPLKQPTYPFCLAVVPIVAVHPAKRELYPCMAHSGSPEMRVGVLDEDNCLKFNELGNSLAHWHQDWEIKARGECAVGDCKFSELCHGGCRATSVGPKLAKGGTPDWFEPFPDCITRILEEIS